MLDAEGRKTGKDMVPAFRELTFYMQITGLHTKYRVDHGRSTDVGTKKGLLKKLWFEQSQKEAEVREESSQRGPGTRT